MSVGNSSGSGQQRGASNGKRRNPVAANSRAYSCEGVCRQGVRRKDQPNRSFRLRIYCSAGSANSMPPAQVPIPELEDLVRTGSPGRKAQALEQIAALFVQGAANFD